MKTDRRCGLLAVSAAKNEIDRVSVVQLDGLTMGAWYTRQADKPDLMINASLWDGKGAIGTIWQDGQLVRNEGAGFGFGVNKTGDWGFGDPWAVSWQDYITGYPALVRDGKVLNHSVDRYVMTAQTKRSVIAAAANRLYLIAADGMTIAQLRKALMDFGVYHAVNLDGGGSARLMVNGKAVNGPTDDRKCPNAIAVWLKKDSKEDKSMDTIKVAIDAGHGKHTAGKRCLKSIDPNETHEWALNSRIAGYVCEHLTASGVDAIRIDDTTGETDVPLADRTTKANNAGCALYVSIHADSGINGGTGGGVTCFMHPQGSSKSKALRDAIYEDVIESTGLRGNRANPKTTADFYVLRKTSMPAVLIECGFMDSATDTPIILTDDFARKAALGIARGICETAGVKMVQESTADAAEPVHWAQAKYDSLITKGLTIHDTRFDDPITRGEVFALLDQFVR